MLNFFLFEDELFKVIFLYICKVIVINLDLFLINIYLVFVRYCVKSWGRNDVRYSIYL